MAPRIILLHAYRFSMAPVAEAFARLWPEAEALPLLDQSLYADAGADGTLPANIVERLAGLFRHAELSGARGIVFTGSTFGPAVERAAGAVAVPVLKADDAMAEEAVARGGRALIVATARRALPVLRANLARVAAARGASLEIAELWVAGAKQANDAGRGSEHDRLIAAAVERSAGAADTVLLGQMSMAPARALLAPALARRTLTSPEAAARRMRELLGRPAPGHGG